MSQANLLRHAMMFLSSTETSRNLFKTQRGAARNDGTTRREFPRGLPLDPRETNLGRRKDIKNPTDGFANSGSGGREDRTGGEATGRELDGRGVESDKAAPRAAPPAIS